MDNPTNDRPSIWDERMGCLGDAMVFWAPLGGGMDNDVSEGRDTIFDEMLILLY